MRKAAFILVLCLETWLGLDLLQAQRVIAKRDHNSAQFEIDGLREAARISAEMLAERDAIDLQRTQELNDARTQNNKLRRAVNAGTQRLSVNATCSPPDPANAGTGGLADGGSAELTADARQDYFTLRYQLALSKQMILGLQDHVRRVCLRPSTPLTPERSNPHD